MPTNGETTLHADLKRWYSQPEDLLEESIDNFVIDLVRGGLLVEIQTRNFSAIRAKLVQLLTSHSVRLVYPIAQEKWIIQRDSSGEIIRRRRSPKHGRIEHIFNELIYIPNLISDSNFSLETLLTMQEEEWINDGKGSWRRKGRSIADRRLLSVQSSRLFSTPQDFRLLIPHELARPFTANQLGQSLDLTPVLASKMVYCLRHMGVLEVSGKNKKSNLYIEVNR